VCRIPAAVPKPIPEEIERLVWIFADPPIGRTLFQIVHHSWFLNPPKRNRFLVAVHLAQAFEKAIGGTAENPKIQMR
jgi:hypothetical protein